MKKVLFILALSVLTLFVNAQSLMSKGFCGVLITKDSLLIGNSFSITPGSSGKFYLNITKIVSDSCRGDNFYETVFFELYQNQAKYLQSYKPIPYFVSSFNILYVNNTNRKTSYAATIKTNLAAIFQVAENKITFVQY